MFNFIKEFVFYKVSKEEKNNVRMKVMEADHNPFCVLLVLISLFQIIMLSISLIRYGFEAQLVLKLYRVLYLALIFICLISYIFIQHFYKHKQTLGYFFVVSLSMLCISLWGVGISYLDSMKGFGKSYQYADIIVFAYVILAISVFIILEPWTFIIVFAVATATLNVLLFTLPYTKDLHLSGVLINSISTFILASLASILCFYRRIKSIRLEIQNEKLNKNLEDSANTDDLTKIFNRRYLTANIQTPLMFGICPTGLMLLDIDHFKEVNDTYGHLAGDKCLSTLGKQISDFIVQFTDSYAIRYGGEEFLIYIKSISKNELLAKAEQFRKIIEDNTIILDDGSELKLTISIGIASAKYNQTYSGLISCSDDALYRAKETRNIVSE